MIKVDQKRVDLLLRHEMISCGLAGEDLHRARRNKIEDWLGYQSVIDDDIDFADQAHGLDGQQIRVAGSSANNHNGKVLPRHHRALA